MDFDDKLERLLQSIDRRQEEFNKEAISAFKDLAKTISSMSSDQKSRYAADLRDRKTTRLRDEVRAKKASTVSPAAKQVETDRIAAVKNLTKSLKSTSQVMGSFTASLTTITDDLVELSGVLKSLPIIGGLVGGAFAGLIIHGIQDTIDSFRLLNRQGLYFGDSIFEINVAATKAGMSLKDFSDLVSKNANVVTRFGLDSIMDLNKSLNSTSGDLRKMGYTTKDITSYLFDYLELQRLGGAKDLNDKLKEQAQAQKLAKIIDDLAVATGESIEEIRKKMIDTLDNNRLKALYQSMGASGDNMLALAGALKGRIPNIENMLADLGTLGSSNDIAQLPTAVQQILRSVVNGTSDADTAIENLRAWSKSVSPKELASWSAAAGAGSDFFQRWVDLWGNLNTLESMDDPTRKKRDRVREQMSQFNAAIQNAREKVFIPLIEAFEKLDPVKIEAIAKNIDAVSSALGNLLSKSLTDENIDKFNKFLSDASKGDFSAIILDLKNASQSIVTALIDSVTKLITDAQLKQKIINSITSGFDDMFGEGSFSNLSKAINNTTSAINSVADFWEDSVKVGGIINSALTTAFGLLTAIIISKSSNMMSGGGAGPVAGPIAGGLAGSTFGKLVGSTFMRHINAVGIGMSLAGMVTDAITGQIDNGTIGSALGMAVGGGIGAFFGGPAGLALGANLGTWIGNGIGTFIDSVGFGDTAAGKAFRDQASDLRAQAQSAPTLEEGLALTSKANELDQKADSANQVDRASRDKLSAAGRYLTLMLNGAHGGSDALFKGISLTPEEQRYFNSRLDVLGGGIQGDEVLTFLDTLGQLKSKGSSYAATMLDNMNQKGLTTFGTGGIANRPSIFGEAGPEAAIPLDNGLRIPIAQIDMRGIEELQQLSASMDSINTNLMTALNGMKNSFDRYLSNMVLTNQNKEEKEILLGIYSQLEDIAGTNTNLVRNSRLLSD